MKINVHDGCMLDAEGLPILASRFGHLKERRIIRQLLDGIAGTPYLLRGLPFGILFFGFGVISGFINPAEAKYYDIVFYISIPSLAFTFLVTGIVVILFGYINISTNRRERFEKIEERRKYYSQPEVLQLIISEAYRLIYGGIFLLVLFLLLVVVKWSRI